MWRKILYMGKANKGTEMTSTFLDTCKIFTVTLRFQICYTNLSDVDKPLKIQALQAHERLSQQRTWLVITARVPTCHASNPQEQSLCVGHILGNS